jgi:kumamolisin
VPAGTKRLVPDVALESDTTPGNYVRSGGSWWIVGGTSGAAPQWAGLAALMVQKKGAALGNPGAFLYGLCGTAAFHDVTSGSNGDFAAGAGYDMVTGLGSYDATKLLAAVGGVTTTTTSSSSTSTIATPTTSTTAPTTPTSTTTVTTSSSSTTTLGAPCLPAGNLCTTDAQCCSSSCKVKAGVKRCH